MTRYTKDHEWVRIEGELAFVGISEYAQDTLGDITFVELPRIGTAVNKGDSLCVVESVKAASDIYAPVGGTVASVNEKLPDAPEMINNSPEKDGWICTIKDVVMTDLAGLMDIADYEAFIKLQ